MSQSDFDEEIHRQSQERERARTNGNGAAHDDRNDDDKLRAIPIREFLAKQTTIEFVIDDILRRGWLYTVTGTTGSGKTGVAVTLSQIIGAGRQFSGKEVQRGPVLYIAGENADEVRQRFVAAEEKFGTLTAIDIIDRSFLLAERIPELVEIINTGRYVVALVDTDQAVSLGSDRGENDNDERMLHAKRLRQLTRAKSRPTVIDLCHPIKAAGKDDLVSCPTRRRRFPQRNRR